MEITNTSFTSLIFIHIQRLPESGGLRTIQDRIQCPLMNIAQRRQEKAGPHRSIRLYYRRNPRRIAFLVWKWIQPIGRGIIPADLPELFGRFRNKSAFKKLSLIPDQSLDH